MEAPGSFEWLQSKFSALLASSDVPFKYTLARIYPDPMNAPITPLAMQFTDLFTSDATGTVAGQGVDTDGLKENLRGFWKMWDRKKVGTFESISPVSPAYTSHGTGSSGSYNNIVPE
ncbi:hypothetical protein PHLCEN_2v5423 [Hermanssonia centrifuga]|uniref:Uncharacterized protein n=1 Tax=Hermanssonia centrifuga TaxID=98765 RepID=A0A2R6P2G6_9APHY|nr:hypothetical protein PHLCEN_2v5423 [Hermanssonia centrifuga]